MHAIAFPIPLSVRFSYRLAQLVEVALLMLLLFALAGCFGTVNPIATAVTPAQKYDAAKLTYNEAVLPAAIEFIRDTSIPASAREAVQRAVATSGDVYRSAQTAYAAVAAARAELAAGATTSEKLEAATRNLEHWTAQLESTIVDLQRITRR